MADESCFQVVADWYFQAGAGPSPANDEVCDVCQCNGCRNAGQPRSRGQHDRRYYRYQRYNHQFHGHFTMPSQGYQKPAGIWSKTADEHGRSNANDDPFPFFGILRSPSIG